LYKKNAIITMTPEDQSSYDAPVVYGHFSKTYFASRRLLASLDWEHPSVANFFSLKSAITGQVDFSDSSQKYHSQYVTLKASVPLSRLRLELGGSLEMAQSEDFSIAFAGDFGIFWALPAPFASRLSLTGLFSSGNTGGIIGAFVPVANKFYGSIIKAKMSGISILNLDYAAMLGDFLGVGLTASHFVRNDLGTYTAWPVNDSGDSGYFMGTEFFARLAWSPLSDVHLILGGGAFLPSLGNVNPGGKPQWRIEMNFIFAIF
jgi:hypothetical protein